MALATLTIPTWAPSVGDLALTYDTGTLTITAITYENLSAQTADVSIWHNGALLQDGSSPPNATRAVPPNTQATTISLAGFGLKVELVGGVPTIPGYSLGVRLEDG